MRRVSKNDNHVLKEATQHWKYVAPLLAYPKNDIEYDLLVERLDKLLGIVGNKENDHPLMSLVDALSNIISSYDEKHFELTNLKSIDALKYLMELHHLKQTDLNKIGSQGVVSEILNEKRKLNLRQINILSDLFNVNAATFIDDTF